MDGDLDVELKDRAGSPSPSDRKQFALSTFSRILTQTQLLTPREAVAEAEPIIAFKDVTIAVEDGFRTRRIVRDATGYVAKGSLTAVMGPSGCGKTTLMRLIADCSIGGVKTKGKVLRSTGVSVGMVFQHDLFPPGMLVWQVIHFYAVVTVPTINPQIRKVAKWLQIDHLLWRYPSSLSGGQQRRLSVACMLVRNHSLLILDEPTSGLSAADAMLLMDCLKRLCDNEGLTVIASLHQPRPEIFKQLTALIIMSKGRVIFGGDPQATFEMFRNPGIEHLQEADHIIDVVTELDDVEVDEMSETYRSSKEGRRMLEKCDEMERTCESSQKQRRKEVMHRNLPWNFLYSTIMLAYRTICAQIFCLQALPLRTVVAIGMGLVIGTMFFDNEFASYTISSMFFCFAFIAVSNLTALATGIEEHELFTRDWMNGMYSTTAYLCSHLVSGILVEGFLGFVFSVIVYWMVDFNSGADHFFFFLLIIVLAGMIGKSVNMLAVGSAPTFSGSLVVSGGLLSINMLFCGFFKQRDDIPDGWRWAYWASHWTYGFGALMVNEFKGEASRCNSVDTFLLRCVRNLNQVDGDIILDQFALDTYNRWELFGYYMIFYVVYNVLTWIVMTSLQRDIFGAIRRFVKRFRKISGLGALLCCLLVIIAIVVPIVVVTATNDDCGRSYRYPKLDGECGSHNHRHWGKVGDEFLDSWPGEWEYEDEDDLPNAREISNRLFNTTGREKTSPVGLNMLQPGLAQFLVHDFAFFQSDCSEGYVNVSIPRCDAVFDPECDGRHVMTMCNVKKKNKMTPWLDLSPLYGTDEKTLEVLRRGAPPGELLMSDDNLLPFDEENELSMEGARPGRPMMMSGDPRANSNMFLLMVHTLWARNHNRAARIIRQHHPEMDDDDLFYTARAANMRSWFNVLLDYGKGYLAPSVHGTIDALVEDSPNNPYDYKYGVDALFWVIYRLHSLIPSSIRVANKPDVLDKDYKILRNYTAKETIFRPDRIREWGFDNILAGMLSSPAKHGQTGMVDDLRNIKYFDTVPCEYEPGLFSVGFDLATVDIMRGRQLKLPRFNDMKIMYGEAPYPTFDEFTEDPYVRKQLEELYQHPNQVEAYVGAHVSKTMGLQSHFTSTVLKNLVGIGRRLATFFQPGQVKWNSGRDDLIDSVTVGSLRDLVILNTDFKCVPLVTNHVTSRKDDSKYLDNPLACGPTFDPGISGFSGDYTRGEYRNTISTKPVQ